MRNSGKLIGNYDPKEFFEQIYNLIKEKLPKDLRHLKHTPRPGNKFTVFRFPEYPYTTYELHFSPGSKNHAVYFGNGYHEIIALYYGEAGRLGEWLEAIRPFKLEVANKLSREVVVGLWSEQWAWMAIDLLKDNLEKDPNLYAQILSQFIGATYMPAGIALQKAD